jgi:hypothetical protein
MTSPKTGNDTGGFFLTDLDHSKAHNTAQKAMTSKASPAMVKHTIERNIDSL